MITRLKAVVYSYEEQHSRSEESRVQYYVCGGCVRDRSDSIIHSFNLTEKTTEMMELIRWIWSQHDNAITILMFCATKARCEQVIRSLWSVMVG